MVSPKVSISGFIGTLKEKPYWGNHFWARGYCIDIVGLDTEMIRKYVKYQETKERESERPKY